LLFAYLKSLTGSQWSVSRKMSSNQSW